MPGDLHTHTTFSDGSTPVAKLPFLAACAGMTHSGDIRPRFHPQCPLCLREPGYERGTFDPCDRAHSV